MQSGNFILFKTISVYIQIPSIHHLINLVGNIVIFIPFGAFILLLSKNKGISLKDTLVLSLSLGLECLQIVFSIGSFDVDDLILNISGGLLGYGAFKRLLLCGLEQNPVAKPIKSYSSYFKFVNIFNKEFYLSMLY
ncbi:MAG: VanZ family protein [Bacillota bacterium]